jgi:hypothetical protein
MISQILLFSFIQIIVQTIEITPGQCQVLLEDYNVYNLRDIDGLGRLDSYPAYTNLDND